MSEPNVTTPAVVTPEPVPADPLETTDYNAYKAQRQPAPVPDPTPTETPAPPAETPAQAPPAPDSPTEAHDDDDSPPYAAAEGERLTPTQKKINKVWAQRKAAERAAEQARQDAQRAREEIAHLRGQMDALTRSRGETPKPATPPAPVTPQAQASTVSAAAQLPDDPSDPRPNIEEFETYEAGVEATARWVARQEFKSLRASEKAEADRQAADAKAEAERKATEEAQANAARSYAEKVAEFKKAHADWDQVVNQPDLPVTDVMAAFIYESPLGPALSHYLGQHPDECRTLAAKTGRDAERALARLEAKVEPLYASAPAVEPAAPASPPPAPVSKAPAPPTPLRGGVVTTPNTDTSDYDEYVRLRQAGRV